jgi:hypothetical protein
VCVRIKGGDDAEGEGEDEEENYGIKSVIKQLHLIKQCVNKGVVAKAGCLEGVHWVSYSLDI